MLIGLVLAACGGSTDDAPDGDAAATVTVKLVAFRPETITVDAGEAVTWTNADPGGHTVTSGTVTQDATGTATTSPDGLFDADLTETGDDFSFTFERAGTYPYFCELHPATMRGEIQVR